MYLADEKIVEIVLSGEKEYFSHLVDRYKRQIFSFIHKFTPFDIEDLAQEIFIKAYENMESFDKNCGKFSTWFYRIAQNHCIDYCRKRKINYTDEDMDKIKESEFTLKNNGPEQLYLKKEEILALEKAMQKLEVKYKLPLVYRYVQDLSYEDIADIMNLPLGTIKTNIYRAKEKLLTYYSD